jgi:hypothetical protein
MVGSSAGGYVRINFSLRLQGWSDIWAMAVPAPTFDSKPLVSRPRSIRTYDHSAFYPTIRPTDVFLCTYPKSGTTWLGFLLAQIFKGSAEEQIDLKSMGRYIPDVNLQYTRRGSLKDHGALADPRFFLCHAAYDENLPRVIYVIRDPRDTMVSYWHYQKFLHPGYSQSLAEFLEGEHWPCEWDEHVASWLLPRRHPNMMVVRYEQLHAGAAEVLRNVLAFAGITVTNQRIEQAVASSRFEQMRSAEEKFGVHGKAGDPAARFIRKGRVGGWRDEMNHDDLCILEDRFATVMREVGYATDSTLAQASCL